MEILNYSITSYLKLDLTIRARELMPLILKNRMLLKKITLNVSRSIFCLITDKFWDI